MLHRMPLLKSLMISCGFGICFLSNLSVCSAEPMAGAAPPSLESVVWAGQGTRFEALQGKTVVVLTYVTWCPKCNAWSGDLVNDLKKAMQDKPVVVLAISTDTRPADAVRYMAQRGFVGPNILHGYDPTIAKRLGFTNQFFNYAIIGPAGTIVESGNGGGGYTVDSKRQFSVAYELNRMPEHGKFRFLTEEMSDGLKQLIFPMELGVYPSSADINRLKRNLTVADRDAFDSMFNGYLDEQLAEAERQSMGSAAEKLAALDTLNFLSTTFKTTEQGRAARKRSVELSRDPELRDELAAKRLYDQALKQAAGNPARQADLLRAVAKRYPGTHYAELAAGAATAAEAPRSPSPEE